MKSRIAVLALGLFAIGTDGFVIAGVLPQIARDTAVTVTDAGLLVTAFAFVYALAAPLVTAAVAGIERRIVLITGMAVFTLTNLAAAAAPGYRTLMAARVATALAAALYSPTAMSTAVRLSPPAQRGRAVAVVLAGMTTSLVVGVPLGSAVGAVGSWRWTFVLIAVLGAVATAGIRTLLPRVPAAPASPLRARAALLRRPAVLTNLGVTVAWNAGGLAVYTFVAPLLHAATGWGGTTLSVLLLLYGVAAFTGNSLGGYGADRWGATRSVLTASVVLMGSFATLAYAVHSGGYAGRVVAVTALLAWGLAGWSFTPPQAHRLVALTPAAGPEVLSLNTSATYLGIAAGAALGSRVLAHTDLTVLSLTGAALVALAFILVLATRRATVAAPERAPAAAEAPVLTSAGGRR